MAFGADAAIESVREIRRPQSGPQASPDGGSDRARFGSSPRAWRSSMAAEPSRADRLAMSCRQYRRGAVHRFEQPGSVAEAGGGQESERSDYRASFVRENVAEHISVRITSKLDGASAIRIAHESTSM